MPREEQTVVIGAGPSGLAVARQLAHRHGVDALVVDRATAPAASWRGRYDGFRLNTCGWWSHLPGQQIPSRYGRWPTRDDLVEYFDDYVQRQRLRLELGTTVSRIDRSERGWALTTSGETYTAATVVVATGHYHTPMLPDWPGREGFAGRLLHSAQYVNADAHNGHDVLVVGSGNSAVDVAVQLVGTARRVRMAVRTPPHLVPRSLAGVPIDTFSPLLQGLPVAVLDHAARVLQRLRFGDVRTSGLPVPTRGLYTALLEDGSIPTIGDQLMAHIKSGAIEIVPAGESFRADEVVLTGGGTVTPDTVIAATGYTTGLEPLVGHLGLLTDEAQPVCNGVPSAAEGLWFSGYDEPLVGPLRAFRRLASPLAVAVAEHLAA